jgi:hypothetical protein
MSMVVVSKNGIFNGPVKGVQTESLYRLADWHLREADVSMEGYTSRRHVLYDLISSTQLFKSSRHISSNA